MTRRSAVDAATDAAPAVATCGATEELSGSRCELGAVAHRYHEHTSDGITIQWCTPWAVGIDSFP